MERQREPNNFASQFLWLVWMVGVIASAPTAGNYSWSQHWRSFVWPFYITYVEVDDYFQERFPSALSRQKE